MLGEVLINIKVMSFNLRVPGDKDDNTADVFKAEASLRRHIDKVVDFLKNSIPGFANIHIKGSASTLGVQESRRIFGRYQLTKQDLMQGRTYADSVVHKANFCLDIHNPSGGAQLKFLKGDTLC